MPGMRDKVRYALYGALAFALIAGFNAWAYKGASLAVDVGLGVVLVLAGAAIGWRVGSR
jgi:hypothetical protein